MAKKTFTMKLKKETPGALSFEETDAKGNVKKGDADGAVMGGAYLRKAALGGANPKKITVTVEY